MRIYVGNLSYKVDEDGLRTAFEAHGAVESAQVIMDRYTGRSRGFGFVEMSNDDEAKEAISAMDNQEISGRAVKVNEAKPRRERTDN
ncbi:MAG: RNA-binding protein [SAR202 cluster bacterium]|nr:RNA-binding protein [SAR202 cluster bacterium]